MKSMHRIVSFLTVMSVCFSLAAQTGSGVLKTRAVINADLGKYLISRHIYGHFSEHLGHCIYGGYWVGENSPIPNTRGIRNDVVEALRKIQIPNLRWPGGCFADEYHWMDGIGPRELRPKMINTHWGGITEDNSFGTHEFMDLCEQLGAEPYICGNVGSGTVEEMSKWVEYLNSDAVSPMTDLRRKNGRDKPWNVKFWGVGNESWGCGGNMTPEFYADQFRRYATFCRNYGNNRLLKIAGGANSEDYNWTEVLMQKIPHWMMWGISLHYYTTNWSDKGPATGFPENRYFDILNRCIKIENAIDRHIAIMNKYDPAKNVALVIDEWGTWYDVEPGTNPGFLYQQNSMRDALVAGVSLNYFNKKADRIKMANLAQTVNVLQALILTKDEKMVLTPTYHVFEMYKVHQDATLLPFDITQQDYYEYQGTKLPALSISASRDKNGLIHITLVNIHPKNKMSFNTEIRGANVASVTGRILTAPVMDAHNTFENPDNVKPAPFKNASLKNGVLDVEMPPMSVVVLELK